MSARQDMDALSMLAVLGDSPDGITMPAMCDRLGWPLWRGHKSKAHIRRLCGETDTINLICEPANGGPWVYRLVGTTEDAAAWVAIRMNDVDSRMGTLHHVVSSLVRATDGRTIDGRKARLLERTFRHLIEDLEALNDGVSA